MKVSPRTALLFLAAGLFVASCGSPSQASTGSASPMTAGTAAPQGPLAAETLIVHADTTSGNVGTPPEEKAASSCVQKNRFPQGESIVWRVRVYSTVSGEAMDDKALASAVLTLPDGKEQPLKYGPHPKGKTDDFFWTTSFKIPADYPTGAVAYKVTATSPEGWTGTFDQFNVESSMLQVIKAGTR